MKLLKFVVSLALVVVSIFTLLGAKNGMKDVMDAKTYWEDQEKTARADIEKLSDGIDELSENENAYYEGLDAYIQGQKDLEEGKKELAEGEKNLAEGEAALAKGEADYAAGIATIRDAEKKYGGNGVPVLKAAYSNVNRLVAAKQNLNETCSIVAGASNGRVTASQAKQIYNNVNELVNGYSVDKAVATAAKKSGADKATIKNVYSSVAALVKKGSSKKAAIESVAYGMGKDSVTAAYEGVAKLVNGYSEDEAIATVAAQAGSDTTTIATIYKGVLQAMSLGLPEGQAIAYVASNIGGDAMIPQVTTIYQSINKLKTGYSVDDAVATASATSGADKATIKTVYSSVAGLMSQGLPKDQAIRTVAVGAAEDQVEKAYTGVAQLVNGYSKDAAYAAVANEAKASKSNIKEVYTKVKKILSGVSKGQAIAMVADTAGKTTKEIHDAYDGYLSYVSGKKELAAAPAKLDAGRKAVAEGKQKLEEGYNSVSEGEAQLTEGEEKLQKFEDGRAQVIDGMETLIHTETYPNITSIEERLGNGYNYMKNDTDIDYIVAKNAVTQANAFLENTGVVVTNELTKKTFGHIAAIATAILAILVALASLILKKGKVVVPGIVSLLVLGAGGISLFQSHAGGTTMSEIAGAMHSGNGQFIMVIALMILTIVNFLAQLIINKK